MSDPAAPSSPDPIRHAAAPPDQLGMREWLVTNGLGGYASGTISGAPMRRYHGILIASLPNPAGRVMMLTSLAQQLRISSKERWDIGWVPQNMSAGRALELVDFRLELGLPVWTYRGANVVLERRLVMSHGLNTTHVSYRLLEAHGPARLELRPAIQFRGHDDEVSVTVPEAYTLSALGARIEILAPSPLPPLRLHFEAAHGSFVIEPAHVPELDYGTEESRGYKFRGGLYSPGRFRANLEVGRTITLTASAESWQSLDALPPAQAHDAELDRRRRRIDVAVPRARTGVAAEIVLAADQFVVRPAGRAEDHVRMRAAGREAWTVIAGYHWFTDWGRDTMISLEGLCLVTGRVQNAASILQMFADHVQDGLVPNMFPEGANEGLYHTADATMWFFHAVDRYLRVTGDTHMLRKLLPTLRDIIDAHLAGTRFGIHCDPADGLLAEGAPGYQLTWMDAKCGDWVVTPRRGKPVEINALWYNALRLMQDWLARDNDPAGSARMREAADRAQASFNQRFWNPQTGHLFDVVDSPVSNPDGAPGQRQPAPADGRVQTFDDPACRPNQLFAISLPNPVLAKERWASVLEVVERELLTPVGLRSLSPRHPDYKRTYRGDLLTRDAAYHQGTVWSWLIGPYVDALLKVRPNDVGAARGALEGLCKHLNENCIGTVAEVFDAEPPFTPGGCVAQAWGVAELLRCLVLTSQT